MSQQGEQAAKPQIETTERLPPSQGQDDENSPMVYTTPVDYRSMALAERPKLQAEGHEVVLQSEVFSTPRLPAESDAQYAKRISETMNDMIRRGVMILNDQCTADVAPDFFSIKNHSFDVGPKSGITKKEYREFNEWIDSVWEAEEAGIEDVSVPEKFRNFEVDPEVPHRMLKEDDSDQAN